MKRTLTVCCTAILLGIILTFTTVRAAESDVIFEGDAKSFVSIAGSNELFCNFTALYPGCDVSRTVNVHDPDSRTARVYIRAEAVSEEFQPVMEELSFSVLDDKGNTLYTASDLSEKILLAELEGGQNRNLRLRLHVNRKTDGQLRTTEGKIRWIFSAEEYASTANAAAVDVPHTGGDYHQVILALSVIVSLSFILFCLLLVRRRTN